jgi:3D (Asp-Asp-Asp) domain-containing protein
MKWLLLLLLLASCSLNSGSTPLTKYTGTQGIDVRFEQNAPPEKVYERSPFPVKIALHNYGAFNVSYDDIFITFSTDPLYISGGITPYLPKDRDRDHQELLGKTISYPKGQELTYDIPAVNAFKTREVYGQRESPTTELTVNVCYAYTTYLSTQVCIDTNLYNQNERTQVCKAKDLTFSGGQGAPIAITQIDVRSIPIIDNGRESIRPEFTIHVQNVGEGYLVGPSALALSSACLLKNIPKDSLNAVQVTASLHNTLLECGRAASGTTKGLVKLEGGSGEISCTVPSDRLNDPLYSSTQNFETTLILNLTYIYKSSARTEIEIQRIPGEREDLPTDTAESKLTGYAYEGDTIVRDEKGNPVSWCNYYGEHPQSAPSTIASYINPTYSCGCGEQTCIQMNRDSPGSCFMGAMCPGATSGCCVEQGPKTGAAGVKMGITEVTMYYTADCADYPGKWSTTNGRYPGSYENCKVPTKGFFEEVKCEGSGYCNGNYYSYNTIGITEALSQPTGSEPKTASGTVPQAHRTIAVNTKPGTPCYVPLGSRVELDFGTGNPWNGEYVAEDVGSAIRNCHIDVYVGKGKSALGGAKVPSSGTLTIIG